MTQIDFLLLGTCHGHLSRLGLLKLAHRDVILFQLDSKQEVKCSKGEKKRSNQRDLLYLGR